MHSQDSSPRRKLFYLHSWLGFNLAVFMTLVVLTGTLAVVADEIDWLFNKELRVQADGEKVSWGTMERAIRSYAPSDTLVILSAGEADYFAYRALMQNLAGKTYYLYVDQWSGEVTGTTNTLTVQRFLRDIHRYLFMPSIIGLPLVTTMAVVLLVSLYTGLKTARNWLTLATRVRLNRGMRVAMGDFHKCIGLWGSWFLILIVVTSFWYFAELSFAVGGVRFEPERPGVSAERAAEYGRIANDADADALFDAAVTAFPDFVPTEIQFSTRPGLAVTVLGKKDDWLVRKRANRVFMDPVDASIIKVQRSTEINWIAYLNETADPLHFGSFGKLSIKLIWFVFGLGLVLMSVTGVYLTWKRVKSKTPTFYQLANIPIVILAVVFGMPYVDSYLSSGLPDREVQLSARSHADIDVQLLVGLDETSQLSGEVRVLASTSSGRLNLQSATLTSTNNEDFTSRLNPVSLSSHVVFRGILPEAAFAELNELAVTLNFATGEKLVSQWNLNQEIGEITSARNPSKSIASN